MKLSFFSLETITSSKLYSNLLVPLYRHRSRSGCFVEQVYSRQGLPTPRYLARDFFGIGTGTKCNIIYTIDFGLAKEFCNAGRYQTAHGRRFGGSAQYASLNNHHGRGKYFLYLVLATTPALWLAECTLVAGGLSQIASFSCHRQMVVTSARDTTISAPQLSCIALASCHYRWTCVVVSYRIPLVP